MKKIASRVLERLLVYRQVLQMLKVEGAKNVFSHILAQSVEASSAQVRRDLMLVNNIGTPQKGYSIDELIHEIDALTFKQSRQKVALIGVGNLGKALLAYFGRKCPHLDIVACFDSNEEKINRMISGCRSYHILDLEKVLSEQKITMAILTIPSMEAQSMADQLIRYGIKGIINFAPVRLKVPNTVYLENVDITIAIEKTAYFASTINGGLQ
jgi:redox-sensing transcriptional repressor